MQRYYTNNLAIKSETKDLDSKIIYQYEKISHHLERKLRAQIIYV